MSAARPNAHIFEKWVRGIRKAVTDPAERCAVYEYIISYQLAAIYSGESFVNKGELSQMAQTAINMIEGDIDEFCEEMRKRNAQRVGNLRNTRHGNDTVTERERYGNDTGTERALQSKAIQSNTIQSKAIQSNNNMLVAFDNCFSVGLELIGAGYWINDANILASVYDRGQKADVANIVGYCAAAFKKNINKCCFACIVELLQESGCKSIAALEIMSININGDVLEILCTQAAANAIEKHEEKVMQYAISQGAKSVKYIFNK